MNKRYGGILIVSVTILVLCFVAAASATTWSVNCSGGAEFTGIQDAINNASDGDTIIVHSGVYYENVVVDKSVTLKGIDQPVVDANSSGSAITLTDDRITLVGFKATNAESSWEDKNAGIKVISSNNSITGNNASNNRGFGIYFGHSCNNKITGNNVRNNYGDGIVLGDSCNNNSITCNTFVTDGLYLSSSSYQNTVEDNTVNGKPLVYLEDVSDYKVEDAGQIILQNCTNITVENLVLSNTSNGIALMKTENSKISNNTVCNNDWRGICLYDSCNNNTITGNNASNNAEGIYLDNSCNNNTITGNSASNNNDDGIHLDYSCNNTITGNNVCNNNDGIILYLDSSENKITGNNATSNNDDGISLFFSSNNKITGNNVCNNDDGISLYLDSSENTITGNNVTNNNDDGISLWESCNINTITGNNVTNNRVGIELYYSSNNNTITGNNASNNREGIRLSYSSNNNTITGNTFVNDGLYLHFSHQTTVEDNTVNGKPLVYLEDVSDFKVEDAGQIILQNCTNITIENLDLSNTYSGITIRKTENSKVSNNTVCNNDWRGIQLYDSCNNRITGNNVCNNDDGIYLWGSSNNTITGNNVCNNNWHGIELYYSSNNTITDNDASNNNWRAIQLYDSCNNRITGNNVCNNDDGIILWDSNNNNKIYLNNFINNTDNVNSSKSITIWNSPFEITYTYDGNAYTNYLGNYWDDYKVTDADSDGIGDISYSINSDNSDNYPLMKPFENYYITSSAYT
jgi:parallel beta-helix repeat protein